MEHNINSLLNNSIEATDGDIGEVKDFYFDDQTWSIRYLIVKTGGWLSGREVLIAPEAIVNNGWKNEFFPVNLTKEQIKNSPDIDTDKPVSRQQEIALYDHYAWEGYWLSGFYPGGYLGVSVPFPVKNENEPEINENDKKAVAELHLRSTESINGYHIHALDGDIGHVNDFIIDDKTWQITFIVVDTHNWLGGKKVLVPVMHVNKMEWGDSKIILDIKMSALEQCKLFAESDFIHWQIAK